MSEILLPGIPAKLQMAISKHRYTKLQNNYLRHLSTFFKPLWKLHFEESCNFGNSRPPASSWHFRYLWIFNVDHTFYKLDVKILAACYEIISMCYFRLPISSQGPCLLKYKLFWCKSKKRQEGVWESVQFVIFKPWEVLWN